MSVESELEQLRSTVRRLQDRQDIHDCIIRESRGRDRHDVEMIAGCFWLEGWDEHGPAITHAPEYPENANAAHVAGFAANSHNLTNHSCDLQGDTAYCETYVLGALLAKDEQTCAIAAGRYLDQLERRNGEWRILYRRTVIDAVATGDATWLHSPAIAGFLKGVRSKADPSYQRPVALRPEDERW